MDEKLSYRDILLEIDKLRANGVDDKNPKMKSLKLQLWNHLENNRKKKSTTKVVPTVMAIRTVKLDPKTLGNTSSGASDSSSLPSKTENSSDTTVEKKQPNTETKPYAKYVLLGIVIALVVIGYKFFKKD